MKGENREIVKTLLENGAGVTPAVVRALADPKNSNYDADTYEAILQDLVDFGWDVSMEHAFMYLFTLLSPVSPYMKYILPTSQQAPQPPSATTSCLTIFSLTGPIQM